MPGTLSNLAFASVSQCHVDSVCCFHCLECNCRICSVVSGNAQGSFSKRFLHSWLATVPAEPILTFDRGGGGGGVGGGDGRLRRGRLSNTCTWWSCSPLQARVSIQVPFVSRSRFAPVFRFSFPVVIAATVSLKCPSRNIIRGKDIVLFRSSLLESSFSFYAVFLLGKVRSSLFCVCRL